MAIVARNTLDEAIRAARGRMQALEEALSQDGCHPTTGDLVSIVIDHAPVVLWVLDRHGQFLLSEGGGLPNLGLVPGQVVGQSVFEVFREFPDVAQSQRKALAGQEVRCRIKVRPRIFDCWIAPLKNHLGLITGCIGIANDITERSQAERLLRKSRARFLSLARSSPIGMIRLKPTGELLYSNHRAAVMVGRSRAELRGQSWLSMCHADDRDTVRSIWVAAVAEQRPVTMEFRLGELDPGPRDHRNPVVERWVLFQAEPSESGRIYVGSLTDISQRRQAELQIQQLNAELEERVRLRTEMITRANHILEEQIHERRKACDLLLQSQEQWRSLVETAPDMILQIERNGTVTFLNHSRIRPSLRVSDVVGANIQDFVVPESRDEVEQVLREVFETGVSVAHEVAGPGDAGERRWFQTHIAPIFLHGKVVAATAVCRDITEQRRAADELRAKQELLTHVARVSMVGEMTAALAHELNQPLAAIAHYVRGCIIRLEQTGATSPAILATMQDAVDEAHRASEVIRRLRMFLQRQELQTEPTSPNELLLDATRLAEPAFKRLHAECRLTDSSDVPLINVDRIQMVQVLLNLLLNAAEAMDAAGAATRIIETSVACHDEGWVVLTVSDTGPGLPQALGDQIFEAFITTKPSGLGLGLSISRSIVEAHQGTLSAEPGQSGSGAMFAVRLPAMLGKKDA